MSDETCGDYGGERADGEPCTRPTAWGRDAETGCCKDHVGMGRPTKLTYDKQERIAQLIEQGSSVSEAAQKAGIHRETCMRWYQEGAEQDEGIFRDFYDRLTRAFGEGEGTYRSAIMQIAIETQDARLLMSMLKQRYPDEWGEAETGVEADQTIINVPDSITDKWQSNPSKQ